MTLLTSLWAAVKMTRPKYKAGESKFGLTKDSSPEQYKDCYEVKAIALTMCRGVDDAKPSVRYEPETISKFHSCCPEDQGP